MDAICRYLLSLLIHLTTYNGSAAIVLQITNLLEVPQICDLECSMSSDELSKDTQKAAIGSKNRMFPRS